jgi:hypothetical protein
MHKPKSKGSPEACNLHLTACHVVLGTQVIGTFRSAADALGVDVAKRNLPVGCAITTVEGVVLYRLDAIGRGAGWVFEGVAA